jgi:hypothetical protein
VGRYAILTLPSANRVYGLDGARLALAELRAVAPSLHAPVTDSGTESIGGNTYIVFETPEVDEHDRFVLSNLSGTYALFALGSNGRSLAPLEVERLEFFGSDLVTIQRYAGKTNEQFTHLLVNVAVAISSAAQERNREGLLVRLLDPLCGRGTTLNRGLVYGFDVTGIDLDLAGFEAYRSFLITYCKDKGIGCKVEEAKVRKGPMAGSRRCTVRIGKSLLADMVKDDTVNAGAHFGARSFDLLVGDLPYGVRHGSTTGDALSRSPEELVRAALPGWRQLLRSGAGLALSWNVKTLARPVFEEMLTGAGFSVVQDAAAFDHRVDRTITRGVVLATT